MLFTNKLIFRQYHDYGFYKDIQNVDSSMVSVKLFTDTIGWEDSNTKLGYIAAEVCSTQALKVLSVDFTQQWRSQKGVYFTHWKKFLPQGLLLQERISSQRERILSFKSISYLPK